MGTINLGPYKPTAGVTSDASAIDNAFDAIQLVLNGHVDDANVDPTSLVATQKGLPLSLTGATQATRYVGATASGAPASGTFAVGDFIIDRAGKVWICISAGAPGTWVDPNATAGVTTYRKTTVKTVNTTTSPTDLLNAEITIGAGILGSQGVLRLTAFGDLLNNNAITGAPRFQVTLGGTTMIDTGSGAGTAWLSGATRAGWRLVCEIMNVGAAPPGAQNVSLTLIPGIAINGSGSSAFATGTGLYTTSTGAGSVSIASATGTNSGLVVDTSAAKALALNIILPASSANVECKLFSALVEVL